MRTPNYDKYPATHLHADLWQGWETIRSELARHRTPEKGRAVWVIECYQGVYHEEITPEIKTLAPDWLIVMQNIFKSKIG